MATKAQEQKWQAESDASTMADYQALMQDKGRVRRAIKVAQERAKDLTKRANVMQNVAKFSNGGRMSGSTGRRKK